MTWLYLHHSSKENDKQGKCSKLLIFDQIKRDMTTDFHTHTHTQTHTQIEIIAAVTFQKHCRIDVGQYIESKKTCQRNSCQTNCDWLAFLLWVSKNNEFQSSGFQKIIDRFRKR